MSQPDIQKCIELMNFVSTIPVNHKPCYNSSTSISIHGWLSTVRRRWNGEKGESGVKYVKSILGGLIISDITEDILPLLDELAAALLKSKDGFNNLIQTYIDQPDVSDGYNECLLLVDKHVRDIQTFIEQYNIEKYSMSCSTSKNNSPLGSGYDSRPNSPTDSGDEFEYVFDHVETYRRLQRLKENKNIMKVLVGSKVKTPFFDYSNIEYVLHR